MTHSQKTRLGIQKSKIIGIKVGRPSLHWGLVTRLRKLYRKGFSLRELQEITELSMGCLSKYTRAY